MIQEFDSHFLFVQYSKLGVPIKTTVSATILEEALNGEVTVRPLELGQPFNKKVRFLFSRSFLLFFFLFKSFALVLQLLSSIYR